MAVTDRLASVRGSAAWAAWGDALGFMSELTDAAGLRHRTGEATIDRLRPWVRKVGGRMGVNAPLPAGTYSDDTQLRLATSRAIREDGSFDVEVFAKVEVATWLNYALGAGTGSKAAATSLARGDTHWNQNMFSTKGADYISVGGNGAAMRIQPHVWSARDLDDLEALLNRVVRDSVCTHGSPVGIVGAAIHALTLAWAMRFGELPTPQAMLVVNNHLRLLGKVIADDEELGGIWMHGWEQAAKRPFLEDLDDCVRQAQAMGSRLSKSLDNARGNFAEEYGRVLHEIGGLDPATRGSGVVTAWMAVAASHMHENPVDSLLTVVNTLGSDTDTIATMAGALIGAVVAHEPPEPVLDQALIDSEADRMATISFGGQTTSPTYPDLMTWNLARSPLDYVGVTDSGDLALAGHGTLTDLAEPLAAGRRDAPTLYRWATTPTGQRVFVRHRSEPPVLAASLLPPVPSRAGAVTSHPMIRVANPPYSTGVQSPAQAMDAPDGLFDSPEVIPQVSDEPIEQPFGVDEAVRLALEADLDPTVVGRLLLALAVSPDDPLDRAAAFAAVIASIAQSRGS